MPATPLSRLIRNLKNLDYTRKRMETLYQARIIRQRDVHSVYEALFLRAVTSFEVFLEELFVEIVSHRAQYEAGRVTVRMRASSSQALMDILLQGDRYMAWLPFKHTEDRAKIYLEDGKPFSELDGADRSVISHIGVIRNAIAHKSSHAVGEFKKTIIGSQSLLTVERTPAGFLRSPVRAGPTRNRFEIYAAELARIANKLC